MTKANRKLKKRKKLGMSIIIDPSLDQYSEKVLFKDKVEAAKRLLRDSPIPKNI